MKWKRILKWGALAVLLILFAWFEFAYWTSTNDCRRNIPAGAERMKAIRFCEYAPPDVVKLEEGKVKPFVEKTYPMTETVEALRYFDQGHTRGKLVITIE